MIPSVDAIIASIPQWAGRTDLRVNPLGGGMTNHNYRIDMAGRSFVLRIGGANRESLGIDNTQEYSAMSAAAQVGVAPNVLTHDPQVGYLVADFIRGGTPSIEQMRQEAMLRRVLDLIDHVHRLPAIIGTFSPFRRAEMLAETARRFGVRFPDSSIWLEERIARIEAALNERPVASVLCHNDLGRRNFIDTGRLMLLDWEYAGMGDPSFDLANFAANQSVNAAAEEFIVGYYFGRVTRARLARLRLLRIMSDYYEMYWCLVQSHVSQHEIDFRGYAETTASFLVERLQDLEFDQLLIDVTRPD